MTRDGGGVATGHRTGQSSLAALQRVVQRRAGQWADDPLGDPPGCVTDELLTQQLLALQCRSQRLDRVEHQGHDVIARMRQRRVVEGAGVLADAERLATDLEHQRLGHGVSDLVGGGDTETRAAQPVDVLVRPGERHRRVDRQRDASLLGQRRQHTDPVGARGVHHDGVRAHRPGGGQTGYQRRQLGIGNGQQQQLGPAGHLVDREHRGVGEPSLGALPGGIRDRAAADDDVLCAFQCVPESGAHAAGGDHADREPGRTESVVRGAPAGGGLQHRRRPRRF